MLHALPDEQFSTGPSSQLVSNGQGLPDDSSESAIDDTRGNAGTIGTQPGELCREARAKGKAGSLFTKCQDLALVDAADDFRGVLHPDGEIVGQEDYLDRSEQRVDQAG